MANIALAVFLILFGLTGLVNTPIENWMIGVAAVLTGLIVGFSGWRKDREDQRKETDEKGNVEIKGQ